MVLRRSRARSKTRLVLRRGRFLAELALVLALGTAATIRADDPVAPGAAASAGPPTTAPGAAVAAPESPEAQAALQRYQLAEAKAREALNRALAEAQGRLAVELQALQDKATKAGNLDEALRLRAASAALKAGAAPLPNGASGPEPTAIPALAKALHGTRWTKTGPGPWGITFNGQDMSVTSTHHSHSGTWAVLGPQTLRLSISQSSCQADVVHLSKDGTQLLDDHGQVDFVRAR